MNYIEYVNYLKSKNIKMFDHDYRISYYNINKYINEESNNMTGGGNKMLIKNYNNDELINIINISLSVRPENLYFLTMH
jgi:hypothetical protein